MPPKEAGELANNFARASARISHDSLAELKEAFFVLDSSGSGIVSSVEIRNLFCSIIPNLGDEGFDRLMEQCHMASDEPLTFAQFFVLLVTVTTSTQFGDSTASVSATTMFSAFAPFDPNDSGFVDSSAFFSLMGEKGQKMSMQELDELRLRLERTGFMKRGRVNYKGFINNLTATTADRNIL